MPDLILIILFCYTNNKLAKRKGKNGTIWIVRTVLAIIGAMFLGAFFIMLSYKGPMDTDSIQKFLYANPLKVITFYVCEIGGGLLIRYLLERMPDSKEV